MEIDIELKIPELWGEQVFKKVDWGTVNFLVGPNGTGKTLFAEQLEQRLTQQGFTPRYLSAERLSGFEKRDSGFSSSQLSQGFSFSQFSRFKAWGKQFGLASDAFVILRERLDLRIRIEATLYQLFGRRMRLMEEGGFLKPKLLKIDDVDAHDLGATLEEYDLKESECHGLKELLTLLTFVYDNDHDCLIVDEPELHLHPQYQSFLLQEFRRVAGDPRVDPTKKCFFLITHSPQFIDIRNPDDLRQSLVVFHPNRIATYIDAMPNEDETALGRLLPRINTHHKQFFLASRPVFVEGYTDQQLLSLLQEKRGRLVGAAGVSIIDVGGSEELALFFRLCRTLEIDARFIADFDVLMRGNLRQSVSLDPRCRRYLQDEGLGVDLMRPLGEMERAVTTCVSELEKVLPEVNDASWEHLRQTYAALDDQADEQERLRKKRYAFLLASVTMRGELEKHLPGQRQIISMITGRLEKIMQAFRCCRVFLLPRGELENHLPSYYGNPFIISPDAKNRVFEQELTLMTSCDAEELEQRYGTLAALMDEACEVRVVDLDQHLRFAIGDWIYKVQSTYVRGEIRTSEALQRNSSVDWDSYSRLFELLRFESSGGSFTCRIKLKPNIDPSEREVEFSDKPVPAAVELPSV